MFENVLIAEDHQSIKLTVEQTLNTLGITVHNYAYYCDDALLRLKTALLESNPYQLLITDLSFDEDGREQKITTGRDLIEAVRKMQPALKILVFSAESSGAVVHKLFEDQQINGFVRKGRSDAIELKDAIEAIFKGRKYISPSLQQTVRTKNAHDFSNYEIAIISQLAKGTLQKDIPAYFLENNIKPAGLSSVEKRLNLIKETLDFSKNEQLVAYCKDNKII
ncbi:response regulator transcription factor [Mucilaginibacter corticis]|uniref:Response regulator transcription factor n=1 Tax=Mucilaginibacter corticis TaxID=2597670 RepID=A0A556M7M3_9SPHI|nr:response regulator [Mucilaginibacter corticis]TSJ35889.1 response regulator transcription factor [Mucilaginibacter corticis]